MADPAPALNLHGARRGGFYGDRGERALWSAVVSQAISDLTYERLNSIDFNTAVAFFLDGGEWRQSRGDVADMLDLHADDLERCGRQHLLARAKANNLTVEQDTRAGTEGTPGVAFKGLHRAMRTPSSQGTPAAIAAAASRSDLPAARRSTASRRHLAATPRAQPVRVRPLPLVA
jgi:hypothetical protein